MSTDANYRVTVNGDNATVHVTNPATNQVEQFTFNVAGAGSYNKADAIANAQVLDVDTTGSVGEIMKRVKIAALENRTTFVKPNARSQAFQLTYDELKRMSERSRPFTFGAPRTLVCLHMDTLARVLQTLRKKLLKQRHNGSLAVSHLRCGAN
jgi:hypothetical protein